MDRASSTSRRRPKRSYTPRVLQSRLKEEAHRRSSSDRQSIRRAIWRYVGKGAAFIGSVILVGALLQPALSKLVEATFPSASDHGKDLLGASEIRVTQLDTPQPHSGEAWVLRENWLPRSNPVHINQRELAALVKAHRGVRVGANSIRVTVESRRNEPLQIIQMKARVLGPCQPSVRGTLIAPPRFGGDGVVDIVQIAFALDGHDQYARLTDANHSSLGTRFFDQHVINVPPGKKRTLKLTGFVRTGLCRWVVDIFWMYDGKTHSTTVPKESDALLVSGGAPAYERVVRPIASESVWWESEDSEVYCGGDCKTPGVWWASELSE